MARKPNNIFQLALDLRHGGWLIHDPGAFMPAVRSFFKREAVNQEALIELELESVESGMGENAEEVNAQKIVIVPIHSALTKYDTCGSYGTTTIAGKMKEYIGRDEFVGFVLDIDSPGGSANAIPPMLEVIRKAQAAGMPVIAHCDSCYSAAYWIASQCDAIFADNEMSGFGSIGAYATILDDREDKQTGFKYITIYAPESADKNAAYREALDGKPERMQRELSALVQSFHSAVKSGRPELNTDAAGVFSGADFKAIEAISVGLADGMATLDEAIEIARIRAEYK